jgi:23S rRNA pseudouridine2605 synthase
MTPTRRSRPSSGGSRSRPDHRDRPRPADRDRTRSADRDRRTEQDRTRPAERDRSRNPRPSRTDPSGRAGGHPRPGTAAGRRGGRPEHGQAAGRASGRAAGTAGESRADRRTSRRQAAAGASRQGPTRADRSDRTGARPSSPRTAEDRATRAARRVDQKGRSGGGRASGDSRRSAAEARASRGDSGRHAAEGRASGGAPEGRLGGGRAVRAAPRGRKQHRDPVPQPAEAGGDGSDGREPLRLNKALSGAGLGSRRAVEELVRAGRVSVAGEVVQDLGRRVDPMHDRVEVDGSRVVLDERRRYWLLNKPAGVVSTAADPEGRPTVVGMVPEQPRVFPVGRLDRDTEGLLLLTNDGPLAYRLTHARYGIEKRYLAEVERLPADAPGRLRQGVELDDGFARPVRVRVVAGSGRRRMIEVVLVEGRNREVRRLLEAVGAPVRRLVRTAVGPIRLTGLAPGEYRPLRPEELRNIYKAAGL